MITTRCSWEQIKLSSKPDHVFPAVVQPIKTGFVVPSCFALGQKKSRGPILDTSNANGSSHRRFEDTILIFLNTRGHSL